MVHERHLIEILTSSTIVASTDKMIKLTKPCISALRSRVFVVPEKSVHFFVDVPAARFHCPLTRDIVVHHIVVVIARLQRGSQNNCMGKFTFLA